MRIQLGLYDFLGFVFPGAILLGVLVLIFHWGEPLGKIQPAILLTTGLIVSYVIGHIIASLYGALYKAFIWLLSKLFRRVPHPFGLFREPYNAYLHRLKKEDKEYHARLTRAFINRFGNLCHRQNFHS